MNLVTTVAVEFCSHTDQLIKMVTNEPMLLASYHPSRDHMNPKRPNAKLASSVEQMALLANGLKPRTRTIRLPAIA